MDGGLTREEALAQRAVPGRVELGKVVAQIGLQRLCSLGTDALEGDLDRAKVSAEEVQEVIRGAEGLP